MAHLTRLRTLLLVGACWAVMTGGVAAAAPRAVTTSPRGSVATVSGDGAGLLACTASSTQRVSVSTGGGQGNGNSGVPGEAISGDGRYVAFDSDATNLVPGDTNGQTDVFVRDRVLGTTERVSVSTGGAQGNFMSRVPTISADGRYVAFDSDASDLVPGDTNEQTDVFVHDRLLGTTERVSVSSSGAQASGGDSSISADGRYVAFDSVASKLAPGDDNGSNPDIFVRDLVSGTTQLVSVSTLGTQLPGQSFAPVISADGRYVAFDSWLDAPIPGQSNSGYQHVYLRDRLAGTTTELDVTPTGGQANLDGLAAGISADGRDVVFSSGATNLLPGTATDNSEQLYLRDTVADRTELISRSTTGAAGDSDTYVGRISADGQYVAFVTEGSNLVPGGTTGFHIFLRDRVRQTTTLVDVALNGGPADAPPSNVYGPPGVAISADGRYLAFESGADDLVAGDTNRAADVFVRDRGNQTGVCGSAATATLSWRNVSTGRDHGYGFAAVTAAGSQVCFGLTWSNNLGTPAGADVDLATAPGTPAVPLFTGAPGPYAGQRSAWGCVTTTPAVAADVQQHPERYLVTVRTAQYPGGAIAGRLQP